MFSEDELKAIATKTLSDDITIPGDHKGALVTIVDTNRVQIVSAIKINDHWKVEVVADHEWTGNNDVGFVSKVTW